MKKIFLFWVVLLSLPAFSQSVNDYQYILVPTKFSFLKESDQFRLNTLTKLLLQKYGFKSFYATDSISDEIANSNCKKLYADVVSDNTLLTTKVKVVLKDCREKVVYETAFGASKEKEYKVAYNEALRNAFKSFDNLHYKYNGTEDVPTGNAIIGGATSNQLTKENLETIYFAQPIMNGFQIIDGDPKIIMKMYYTSQKDVYIGIKGNFQGVVLLKKEQWLFEYYEKEQLVSEPLKLKF